LRVKVNSPMALLDPDDTNIGYERYSPKAANVITMITAAVRAGLPKPGLDRFGRTLFRQ